MKNSYIYIGILMGFIFFCGLNNCSFKEGLSITQKIKKYNPPKQKTGENIGGALGKVLAIPINIFKGASKSVTINTK
jgi:hypothetical protein